MVARELARIAPPTAARVVASLVLVTAPGLTACLTAGTQQPEPAVSVRPNPTKTDPIVIHGYRNDLAGIRAANPAVKLRVGSDPTGASGPVLFVEYPPPTNDPAGRDVQVASDTRDWSAAGGIGFRIKPDHAIKLSVSFLDRNRVAYTAWTQLRAGEWQSVRIAFKDIRPNPYFQPPGAKVGAPIDVGEVPGIGFAPQDPAAGGFVISQLVLVN